MNTLNAQKTSGRYAMLTVTFLAATLALYACGGGGNAVAGSGELTQSQFDALLKTSALYTDLTTKLAADEATIARMEQFGHSRKTTATRAAQTRSINTQGGMVNAVSFGPCADMGMHVGDSQPDPASADTVFFKQCVINGAQYVYGANQDGTIGSAFSLWYTDSTCGASGGSMIEFENDGAYNRSTLQQGVVFTSPKDGSELMVTAGQAGTSMTAQSNYSAGACNVASETHVGYTVQANDVSVTGVPASVPSDFIY